MTRLQLHVQNMQHVRYDPTAPSQQGYQRPYVRRMTLTGFFELCRVSPQETLPEIVFLQQVGIHMEETEEENSSGRQSLYGYSYPRRAILSNIAVQCS